jgi:parvulin-like peptidyl-prolyl isomerase
MNAGWSGPEEVEMKRWIMVGAALGVAWVSAAETVTVDGVAAYVNDAIITVGEVQEAIAQVVPQLRQVYEGRELQERIREAYGEAVEDLIAAKLILKAYEDDAKLNKDAIEKHVEKKISEFVQDKFGGDRQEFLKVLREERLSMEEWRRRMRERVIVGLMKNREVDARIVIAPNDVLDVYRANAAKYYREQRLKLGVIVIHGSTNETDRAVRQASARAALEQARGGTDFADLARKVSEDGKAGQGGDWGWVDTRDLRPELATPATALAKGGLSDLIEMGGDFYILRLEDRKEAGPLPFEEVRGGIERELRRKEARRLTTVWLARLKQDAYIHIVTASAP